MADPDPRLRLAMELRAAGLVEKADEILAEVLRGQTGIRPTPEVSRDLDDVLARLRSVIGARPRRRRAVDPRPTVHARLVVLLAEAGITGLSTWKVSRGYWLRDQQDVMRWECLASRWGYRVVRDRRADGYHVGSWSSMSDCVRHGITVTDGERRGGGYCTISVEANYPKDRKQEETP